MSGYSELKNAIKRVVKTNNNREITGQNLQNTLTSMVNSLGANYHFAGFASPSTNPGTPDQNVFYIASEEGTYVNFNSIVLESGLSFLMWNGQWSSQTVSVGEVTKSWVQQNYVSIAFFNELFELYNNNTKIAVNGNIPVDKSKLNIKAMFGFWTEQYISALGKNGDGGSGGGGIDMTTVWSALAGNTDEQINKSHLTTALNGYATTSWISQNFATLASIPTKVSQLINDEGFITSAALPTNVSQLINDAGFITNAALPTNVSQLINDAGYVTASIVDGYATQNWVNQNFVTISFFERLFKAYNGTTKVNTNSTSTIDNIKAMFGFWTEQYISALGKNEGGGSSGGIDMTTVWSALAGNTDEQINKSHLTTALAPYALKSDIPTLAALSWSGYSSGSYNGSEAKTISIPNNTNQLTNGAGYITSSALSGYLPLTGGTLTGGIVISAPNYQSQLTVKRSDSAKDAMIRYENSSGFLGAIGMHANKFPYYTDNVNGNNVHTLWHTGNLTKVSQLTNDAGYVTSSIVNGYATQSWVSGNFLSFYGGTMLQKINFEVTSGDSGIDCHNSSQRIFFGIGTSGNAGLWTRDKGWIAGISPSRSVFLHGNSDTATKIETARTLWGQSFDGSSNVSGSLSGVGDIASSSSYFLRDSSSNPYLNLKVGSQNWYAQSISDGLYLGSTLTKSLKIDASGNVNIIGNCGIGTASPSYKLHIAGTVGASDNILVEKFDGWIGVKSPNANEIYLFGASTSGYIWGTTNGVYLRFYNGLVGVGTSSPSYKLDVAGVIHSNTGIFSDGYVSALGQNTSSDIRKKDIKENFALSVDQIASAPSVKYLWKDDKDKGLQVGSIAQYWQNVLPEAVHEDNDGYLTMQYGVIALLSSISVASKVQNHERRIKELEKECERLRTEVEQLRA